jgi:hypothetical protein
VYVVVVCVVEVMKSVRASKMMIVVVRFAGMYMLVMTNCGGYLV